MNLSKTYRKMENAIFIMGSARSGTTFLGSLIGSHSECVVTPESHFKIHCYPPQEEVSFDPEKTFNTIKNIKKYKNWNTKISFTASEFDQIKNYSDLLLEIVKKYNINKQHKKTAKIWVEHAPHNLEYVELLKSLYPNAKFIHIIRDGRAIAASYQNITWGPRGMKNIASHWLKSLAYGFAYEAKYPEDVLSVKYEDLLSDTKTTVKKITDFIGLEYENNMLQANGLIVPEYTKHQHGLVGKKADKARINAWEKTLTKREIELFEHETKNMLDLLEYDRLFIETKKEKRYERILFKIKYKYVRFMNKRKKHLK